MANSAPTRRLGAVSVLITVYASAMVATVVALAVMAAGAAPGQATQEAWGHAVIVTVLAFVLVLRLRAARAGRTGAVKALGIIAAVLLVVNVVEAALPGAFPGWMRIEMVAIALLMAVLLALLRRSAGR